MTRMPLRISSAGTRTVTALGARVITVINLMTIAITIATACAASTALYSSDRAGALTPGDHDAGPSAFGAYVNIYDGNAAGYQWVQPNASLPVQVSTHRVDVYGATIWGTGTVDYLGLPSTVQTPGRPDAMYLRGTDSRLRRVPACWPDAPDQCGANTGVSSDLGGVLTSSPAAVTAGGTSYVFARDVHGGLAMYIEGHPADRIGQPPGWHALGGYFVGDPQATVQPLLNGDGSPYLDDKSRAVYQVDVFAQTGDGSVWDQRVSTDGPAFAARGWQRASGPEDHNGYVTATAVGLAAGSTSTFRDFVFVDFASDPDGTGGQYCIRRTAEPVDMSVTSVCTTVTDPDWPRNAPVIRDGTVYALVHGQIQSAPVDGFDATFTPVAR